MPEPEPMSVDKICRFCGETIPQAVGHCNCNSSSEPEYPPMTWEEAEWWEKHKLFFAANIHIIWQAIALARKVKARVDECNEELKELRHKCGCRFDNIHKSKLLEECLYHAEIRECAEKAEKERDEEISKETDFWEKKAAKAEARLAAAGELAEAIGKLPITGGPVWDALRAFKEAGK